MQSADFLIIGAGIAGSAAAYKLGAKGRTIILERESQPGYHSTGRSAAVHTENYGNAAIRGLTVACGRFLRNPPPGFADQPILGPRGALLIGRADQRDALDRAFEAGARFCPTLRRLDAGEAAGIVPLLNRDYVDSAVYEPDAMDIDVNALHQGYLRGARSQGTTLVTNAEVVGLTRANGTWTAKTTAGDFSAPVVVNAAGAWADEIAGLAGTPQVGLVPKRRTAFIFDAPAGFDTARWPITADVEEQFYFKPEAGRFMGSPADETPMPPCDVQPEELDIALAADRIQQATTLEIRHIRRKWAGLRSFVADRTLVIGPTARAEGFHWLAAQGGYGIQTSYAAADCLASLIDSGDIPSPLKELGLTAAMLSPDRPLDRP